ncbi:D-alanyl-D-alanine carboxypeptidase family protein [Fictibacillus gelatini]|uniref:D-alanyl-D-alanine carboxypeptidase family protein n=1 Tax=Fictibacillus gelatini TaxID=225985 RepID=UPI00040FDABC|nr:D-alanyl-D-alanine carboxypeptidase family protein [Fictibacillus gelatini]
MFFQSKKVKMSIVILLFVLLVPAKTKAVGPGVSARAAVLMEQESGRVLFGKEEHRPMRIASITKIMTAIIAIESGKMSDKVKISEKATRTEGSSLYLTPGERVPLRDLVYGLMLRSGNDAAVAIAEHVGGSVEGFELLMNQKAREIGMEDTNFRNPHGLDDHEDHYSSAYDMALLTRYAMNNKEFRKISSTKVYRSHQEGEKWDRIWKNKNKMLKLYRYSTGGKTGFTKRAKRTLVSTAKKDGMGLIAVTLDDPNDWEDHENLFNWGFQTYDLTTIVKKGVIDGIRLKQYENKIEANRTFQYPLMKDERKLVKTAITLYRPPKDGKWQGGIPKPIGRMQITLNSDEIGNLPLYYEGKGQVKEEKKGLWNTIKHFLNQLFVIRVGD